MTRRKSLHSGRGVHVPAGLAAASYARSGSVAAQLQMDAHYLHAIAQTRRRMRLAALAASLAFMAIGVRLVMLALPAPGAVAAVPGESSVAPTARADIVDRNGELLATSLMSAALYADRERIWDVRETATAVARVLPRLDADALIARLERANKRYVPLARDVTPQEKQAVFALGLPGLEFPRHQKRIYPRGRDAAHVIGFVDSGNRGIAGIEQSLEPVIRAAAQRGEQVALSLDMRIQYALQDELMRTQTKFSAKGAAGVMLDVRSGEVLALASLPDFDPNAPTNDPEQNRFNQVTKGIYEIGSVFKTFTVAMALDSGLVSIGDGFDASRPLRIASHTINDFHGKNRWLSVPEIFIYSSNIGTAKIAKAVGIERHKDFLRALGFYDRSPIELPEVGAPKVPDKWREISAAEW